MAREVGVNVIFSAPFDKLREGWDSFISYTENHQPRITAAVGGDPSTGGRTSTFGGMSTVAPSTTYGTGILGSTMGNAGVAAAGNAQRAAQQQSPGAVAQDLVSRLSQASSLPPGVGAGVGGSSSRANASDSAFDRETARWDRMRLRTDLARAGSYAEKIEVLRTQQANYRPNTSQHERIEGDIALLEVKAARQAARPSRSPYPSGGNDGYNGGNYEPWSAQSGDEGGPMGPWNTPRRFGSQQAPTAAQNAWAVMGYGQRAGTPAAIAARIYAGGQIAKYATDFMQQQNQYNIAMGGATGVNDAINAQVQYQDNDWKAQLSVLGIPVGAMGMAIREGRTGDRAALAASMAARAMTDQNSGTMANILGQRYSFASQAAGLSGNYAGQKDAIRLAAEGAIAKNKADTSAEVTRLSADIEAVTGGRHQLPREQADKVAAIQARIGLAQQQSDEFINGTQKVESLQIGAVNRDMGADRLGSAYQIAELQNRFSNSRGADRTAIQGQYDVAASRIGNKNGEGQPQIDRLNAQMRAELGLEEQQYGRQNDFLSQGTSIAATNLSAKALATTHHTLEATLKGIKGQIEKADLEFSQNTAGLSLSDPLQMVRYSQFAAQHAMAVQGFDYDSDQARNDYAFDSVSMIRGGSAAAQRAMGNSLASDLASNKLKRDNSTYYDQGRADIYNAQYGVDDATSRLGNTQMHLGTQYQIDARNEMVGVSALQGRMMGRSASALGEITSDKLAIESFNNSHTGSEWASQRNANTQSYMNMQQQSFQNLQFLGQIPGNAQEVSGMTSFGNFSNVGFKDYQSALDIAGGGGATLQKASDDSTSNLSASMDALSRAMDALSQLLPQLMGAGN